MIFEIAALIAGLAIISYSSEKSVEYSSHIARRMKIPPLVIGVVLVSLGTDIPEIANSIFSSYTGHGDINVGDTLGSSLTQISLVLGMVALLIGTIKARRRNIALLGGAAIIAVALAAFTVLDGELTREDGLFLMASYFVLLAVSYKFSTTEFGDESLDLSHMKDGLAKTGVMLVLALAGVAIGAVTIVESVIRISSAVGIPEYFISFFVIGLGTSLPELAVEFAAARKKQFGLLLGDMMGSNITDATFALGIGPLIFPAAISGEVIAPVAIYVVIASIAIVSLFAWREKIDRKAGVVLIALYLLSYFFVI